MHQMGNVLDVLLKSQQLTNQYNKKRTALLFLFTYYRDKRFLSL